MEFNKIFLDKYHLAAKVWDPGFVLEFDNYSINVDDSMSLISLLHGASQILSPGDTPGFNIHEHAIA